RKLALKVEATDALGRTAFKTLTAYVETSPYLTNTFLNDENVRGIGYHKLLVADKVTGYPVLIDLRSGQRSAPLINQSQFSGIITPEGGVVLSADKMYEWRNGQIVFQLNELAGADVSGDYMMWRKADTVIRRNRFTGVIDSFKLPIYNRGDASLGPTGLITFTDQPGRYGNVYKYDSGKVTNISAGLAGYKSYPVTDGKNIIYSTSYFGDTEAYLYFYNGQAQINVQLGESPVRGSSYGMLYQMNSRYSAFMRRKQLVLRDSLGTMREMTSFVNCPGCTVQTMLVLLNEKGDAIVSRTDSGMFLVRNNGQIKHITNTPLITSFIGDGWAGAVYDGSDFYVRIGNRLFKLNLDSVPAVHVSDFEKRARPDSTLHFSAEDFTSHFSGPVPLTNVKFTQLPRHGVLKQYNWAFPVNTSLGISSAQYLAYTPDSAYTGTDTIRWVPYNGIAYTTDTASVFIHVTDSVITVPHPVVSGLSSSYCAAADSQRVKIANLPAAGSGIAVEVLLDSTRVLPVAADSTFTIHPGVLSTGRHSISVTFSYDTIQKRLPLSFMVTPAVTPSLDVSVNVNPITTDSIPVIITATNVAGGGKQPLYTFAWDRNFINQLQLESNSNSVTVAAAQFELGDNVVYARVRTSDQCYTSQTGIDSITINKTNITAVVDVDNPGQPVIIYPNPFREQISVNGLQATRTYILSLYDIQGKLLLHQRVVSKTKTEIRPPAAGGGIYILRIYDEKAQKLIGTQKLAGY
ncbi:MAG TPA: T9SS type A sorting domain-containing protein, partial [Chitinophaga sp.]